MKKLTTRKNSKKGFTLIELIIVIAILAILALIAIPRLAGFTESAKQANDEELAAIVANAGAMYMASHQDDTDVTLTDLNTAGLIDSATPTLKSTTYKALVFTATETTGSATVRLQLVAGTDDDTGTAAGVDKDYVITK